MLKTQYLRNLCTLASLKHQVEECLLKGDNPCCLTCIGPFVKFYPYSSWYLLT